MNPTRITISCGINTHTVVDELTAVVAGRTVGWIRQRFAAALTIPPDAKGYINRSEVNDDAVVQVGDELEFIRPGGRKGYSGGERVEEAVNRLEIERDSTQRMRDVLRAFEALPPAEQHQVAVEILRRSEGSGDIPDEAFNQLAAELFRTFDAEESADADPFPG